MAKIYQGYILIFSISATVANDLPVSLSGTLSLTDQSSLIENAWELTNPTTRQWPAMTEGWKGCPPPVQERMILLSDLCSRAAVPNLFVWHQGPVLRKTIFPQMGGGGGTGGRARAVMGAKLRSLAHEALTGHGLVLVRGPGVGEPLF